MIHHEANETNSLSSNADAVASTVSPSRVNRCRRLLQNHVLIWLDINVDQSSEDNQKAILQLQNVIHDVHIFTDPSACIDFLTNVTNSKIFLIANDDVVQRIIPDIHDCSQLNAIAILRNDECEGVQWSTAWSKITGVYRKIEDVCEALQQATKRSNHNSIAMSFLALDTDLSSEHRNQLEPSFMFTQIFKEILLNMEYKPNAMQVLTAFCRALYSGRQTQLDIIDEFERTYSAEKSIWWYTREPFIYAMLNQALRNLESSVIIDMSFFIHDLHRQIEALHRQQSGSYGENSLVVYRGQGLSSVDFEKFQKTKGQLVSFNNFLSTSRHRNVSWVFADSSSMQSDTVGILFKITVDPAVSSAPFADIRAQSHFDTEEEILFSMHTVFRVENINPSEENDRLYYVDLTMTSDDDEQLRVLTNYIQSEMAAPTGWDRLSKLLLRIREDRKAEELYQMLLEQTSDENEKAHYYNQLGYVKDDQGDYQKAIQYYKQGLEIRRRSLPPNDPFLATVYNNIGAAYRNIADYSNALSHYEKALAIRQSVVPPPSLDLAQSYCNIGHVHHDMGDQLNAISFHQKALDIREADLPPFHPDTAISYNNIGAAYEENNELSKSLIYYKKARDIFERTLQANHPSLATSYNNIGEAYRRMKQYTEALSFHEKALQVRETVFPLDHLDKAQSYNNIGMVYKEMDENTKALVFYEKARRIFEKMLQPNNPSLASLYDNIGMVYEKSGKLSEALLFYEKARDVLKAALQPNHLTLAMVYESIGDMYDKMEDYSQALSYLIDALEMFQRVLPNDHIHLEVLGRKIEVVSNHIQ